jgi:hypothetical protein
MTQAWTPEQAKADVGEDGDILAPLKRVFDKYIKHVARINDRRGTRDFTEKEKRGILYYGYAANAVQALVEQ